MVLKSTRYDVPTYLVLFFFFTCEKLIRMTDISFLRHGSLKFTFTLHQAITLCILEKFSYDESQGYFVLPYFKLPIKLPQKKMID